MHEKALEVVVMLRALEMAYIHTHHHVQGSSFFGDHGAAGGFYEAVGADADAASERFIGLFGCEGLAPTYWAKAAEAVKELSLEDNRAMFMSCLLMEKTLIEITEELCAQLPREADKQLYSGIGDKAVARTYQLKQRCKEA